VLARATSNEEKLAAHPPVAASLQPKSRAGDGLSAFLWIDPPDGPTAVQWDDCKVQAGRSLGWFVGQVGHLAGLLASAPAEGQLLMAVGLAFGKCGSGMVFSAARNVASAAEPAQSEGDMLDS
jgi:hypothetical protein